MKLVTQTSTIIYYATPKQIELEREQESLGGLVEHTTSQKHDSSVKGEVIWLQAQDQ